MRCNSSGISAGPAIVFDEENKGERNQSVRRNNCSVLESPITLRIIEIYSTDEDRR